MLTTEECLLSDVQARNPGLSREQMEQIFRDYLGVTNTLWLKNGIASDDTHGHVDDLAFHQPSTVVIAVERDKSRLTTSRCRRIPAAQAHEGRGWQPAAGGSIAHA